MRSAANKFDICVLIPCFNNTVGLLKSLQSIRYDADKICVVVVDDGSTEPVSEQDLQEQIQLNFRIIVLRNKQNSGITITLNTGLRYIEENLQTNFIARLDCGDTCHPDRFYEQIDFMENNPEVGLLGTWCVFESPESDYRHMYKTPLTHDSIMKEMHFRNVFIHPTVMFRTSILKTTGYYPENYPHVEDYAFFMIIAEHFKTAVIGKVLVTCEINVQGISIQNRKRQLKGRYRVVKEFSRNPALKLAGLLKLKLLMLIPYRYILKIKNRSSIK